MREREREAEWKQAQMTSTMKAIVSKDGDGWTPVEANSCLKEQMIWLCMQDLKCITKALMHVALNLFWLVNEDFFKDSGCNRNF